MVSFVHILVTAKNSGYLLQKMERSRSDELITHPPHEPGLLLRFLSEKGVNTIIAGGMGSRAQGLFSQNNIDIYFGVEVDEPKNLVQKLLNNTLVSGVNLCDH